MLSCGVVGCGVAWWDMVVCAYIYMCVYVCVSVVHDTRYDMTFQIKQKSISLMTAVPATNKNKKTHHQRSIRVCPQVSRRSPPCSPLQGRDHLPQGFYGPVFSHPSLSTPQRDACMGTWGNDCGERWLPDSDLMEDGGNLVILKIFFNIFNASSKGKNYIILFTLLVGLFQFHFFPLFLHQKKNIKHK